MPFDTLTMAAISDEIRDAAGGGQIQRIIQPSGPTVSLSLYASGSLHTLVLSADARFARVHLASERLAKGFATPSAFVMLLRKHLEGSRLLAVEQEPYERVLRLICGSRGHQVTLIAEIMGKHSNIMLLDADDTVLGALKFVPLRQSRIRPVLAGGRYTAPPARTRDAALFGSGERIDPAVSPGNFTQVLLSAPVHTPVTQALMGLLPGAGPFLVHEIALRAGVNHSEILSDPAARALQRAGAELYELYRSRDWAPCSFADDRGRHDFAPFEPVSGHALVRLSSVSLAVESDMGRNESRDALGVARRAVLQLAERALTSARQRVSSLQDGLAAAAEAESAMQRGQLILAYQYRLQPHADLLEIPELETSIALDPTLTPSQNAEKAFRRYRKLRDAQSRIPGLLASAEAEVSRLDDLIVFARLAENEGDLRDLERSVARPTSEEVISKREKRRGPARFQLAGHTLIVGRNARENDEVTFRIARRDDLWLHARERTGAHVILQSNFPEPPDDILEAAAALAAYFSEGRNDTAVDVAITRVRDVRKVPGGPPGRVTYRAARTLRVTPGRGDWQSTKS